MSFAWGVALGFPAGVLWALYCVGKKFLVGDDDTGYDRCESCGAVADVRLADDSIWCFSCHGAALDNGYDTDRGTVLSRREA